MHILAKTMKGKFQEILFFIIYIRENLMALHPGPGSSGDENYHLLLSPPSLFSSSYSSKSSSTLSASASRSNSQWSVTILIPEETI